MKKEQQALTFSAIINVIVSFLKIWGGMLSNCYTLIADGIYTISDFVTDILAMIGAKVGKKRANKRHPFGYGRFEYIMQMIIGIMIFLIGVYIAIKSFFVEYTESNMKVIFLIIFIVLLKGLSANYLMQIGKDISSQILITSAKESYLDLLSSIMVIFIVIIGHFIPVIDLIGSVLMAILIIIVGSKIIFNNVILLIGEDDNNKEIKKELKRIINEEKSVLYSDSFLIKNGSYYQATIEIGVDDNMTVKDLLKLEIKIKNKIKKNNLKIKYINFDIIKK